VIAFHLALVSLFAEAALSFFNDIKPASPTKTLSDFSLVAVSCAQAALRYL
jgi:hypothetical protein